MLHRSSEFKRISMVRFVISFYYYGEGVYLLVWFQPPIVDYIDAILLISYKSKHLWRCTFFAWFSDPSFFAKCQSFHATLFANIWLWGILYRSNIDLIITPLYVFMLSIDSGSSPSFLLTYKLTWMDKPVFVLIFFSLALLKN